VARITIEDCMEKVSSRFQLVHMAAKRVRQIREGSEYLVSSPKNEDIVVALREIAAEKVRAKTVEIETDEPNESLLAAEETEAPKERETPETEESPETDV
jgi:DNA-directed RNA polymerase subunit omega